MDVISYTEARQHLAAAMDKVVSDAAPLLITRQKAAPVVMMSLEEFNSMNETMYLLGNPANAEHLRRSIADIEAGKTTRVDLEDLNRL